MGKRQYTHHIYHHKDKGDQDAWIWINFGIPLVVYAIIIFFLMHLIGLDLTNFFVFIVGSIISIFLAVITSKKLDKFFNKISKYLNNK